MADHEHGSMNTDTQEKTYNSFMNFVTKAVIAIIAFLVLLAIFAR
ncbi:aa3-type cytochrome c oxidase subunit IV [Sulfitobacter albidus]|uniref:Aa3-type cytochrome c oxidase subunit IV n=1 Tax=Sulfitobacter albidus TaxID=2829501 RepID=A0A975JCJ6_9RHOB|nr:aa3-type cytochrome c oxidase subunit IV [Sulfitobacter albidus]QUJ75585.1 aa3-type cytochrome c oxidase subunit IV [Sulfitobacter albidus]